MHFVLVYKWQLLSDWLANGVLSREMATSACSLINGVFCRLWFDWWRLLAYGLMNGDFCLWFDWWRLLPVVWWMETFACGLTNDVFFMCFDWWRFLHVLWLMKTPAKWLIDMFYHQKWRLLSGFWLVGFVPKEWLLRHQLRCYIGSYAHHWFDGWINGWFNGLFPLQWLN